MKFEQNVVLLCNQNVAFNTKYLTLQGSEYSKEIRSAARLFIHDYIGKYCFQSQFEYISLTAVRCKKAESNITTHRITGKSLLL